MIEPKPRDPLLTLPGIGPSLAEDLRDLGFFEPADLYGQDPEELYKTLSELRGEQIDRCVLYAFRCAVYSVTANPVDPELLKWWKWKDRAFL